ncbi:MAG: hotdog fold thioesterase [Rhizobiales bacterium]|nr:hotdog fold thioesterase [Hyphomicrobiales bacterium]
MTNAASNPDNWPPNIKAALKRMAPASRYLGLEILEADKEAGFVKIAFNAGPELCNMWGGIQGGMVAAMLDDAMAFAVGLNLEWGQISPTLELKVSMIAPARPGRLYATGKVIKRGRSVGFVEGELTAEDGTLLATGSSTATFVTLKRKEEKPASA